MSCKTKINISVKVQGTTRQKIKVASERREEIGKGGRGAGRWKVDSGGRVEGQETLETSIMQRDIYYVHLRHLETTW